MSIFAAFILALLISLLFAPGYRKGSYAPLFLLFFILFMAGIASHYWIMPFGPVWLGVAWGPPGFIMLIFALLFIAPSPYERAVLKPGSGAVIHSHSAPVSIFFWILLVVLMIVIMLGVFIKQAS